MKNLPLLKKIAKLGRAARFAALVTTLLAAACAPLTPGVRDAVLDKKMMQDRPLVDQKRFIEEEGKRAHEEHAAYGPVPASSRAAGGGARFSREISRVQAPDSERLRRAGVAAEFRADYIADNLPVETLARMVSELSGVNILVGDEVTGTVSAKLRNVPWESGFDTLLEAKGLAKTVERSSGVVTVHKQNVVGQLSNFNRQRRTELQESIKLESASAPTLIEAFKIFYADPDNVKNTLTAVTGAGEGSKEGAQFTVDKTRNLLLVKASEPDLQNIRKVIELMDTPVRQVFIEAFIVEVGDNFLKELGARLGADVSSYTRLGANDGNFSVSGTAGPADAASLLSHGNSNHGISETATAGSSGAISVLLGLNGLPRLKMELTALEREGLTRVMANPRIFTLDNREAVIFQGDEVPYQTVSQDGTKVEFKQAGLRLMVTPVVIGDGTLQMKIGVNKDTVNTSSSNPPITKSEIQTNLISQDGEIVVIGGIYTESDAGSSKKVPGPGDMAGPLGGLFRNRSGENTRKELMVFIAPKII